MLLDGAEPGVSPCPRAGETQIVFPAQQQVNKTDSYRARADPQSISLSFISSPRVFRTITAMGARVSFLAGAPRVLRGRT